MGGTEPHVLDLTLRPDVEDLINEVMDVLNPIIEATGLPHASFEAGYGLAALLGPDFYREMCLEKEERTLQGVRAALAWIMSDEASGAMQEDGSIVRIREM